MSSVEFEDPVGGLMPQILALTAPPGTKEINNKPLNQPVLTAPGHPSTSVNGQTKVAEAGLAAHPYFRRPGRGHNHDSCDACSEGGDLICCDLCPASFHLTCHDPPLEEDEIPTGEWACHQCRMGGNEDEKTSNSSNKSTKSIKGQKRKEDSNVKEEVSNKVFSGGRELEISDTPLYTLIRAAAVVNPIQFTLPYELTVPANFPGEPKDIYCKRNGSKRSLLKKKPYELDNGIVPLPAKLCFQCNKSCRVGPLIPCDFCPLLYHLDCLDPPLTMPPMGRWMCPNHPEHHLDTTHLTSHSLTERVKLWDKFSVPLDQDAVKLNFFQRCHRLNPPFRFKVKKALRSRLRVPGAVKAHYEDPPDLLPPLSHRNFASNSVMECVYPVLNSVQSPPNNISSINMTWANRFNEADERTNILHDLVSHSHEMEKKDVETNLQPTKEEKFHWLSSLLHLQSSILRHIASNYSFPTKSKIIRDMKMESSEECNGFEDSRELTSAARPKFLNGDLVSLESRTHHKLCSDRFGSHISHSRMLSSTNSSRNFKSQRSNLLPRRHCRSTVPSEIISDTLDSLEILLKERLEKEEDKQDIPLSCLEHSLVDLLAYERLKEILDCSESEVVFSSPPLASRALLCPLVPDVKLKSILPKSKRYSAEPIPMIHRVLNIGKGNHNHLNLEFFGHCNYISSHHATIMFDETTGHYELLNYSEYETIVDGVTYHCDYENRSVDQAPPPPYLQQIKAFLASKRKGESVQETTPLPAMNSRPGNKFVRCNCQGKKDLNKLQLKDYKESGWEGAAVLHHGSFIRFGCLKFVFSVVEEASAGDWFEDTTATYAKFMKLSEDPVEEEREELKEEKEDISDSAS